MEPNRRLILTLGIDTQEELAEIFDLNRDEFMDIINKVLD